MARLPCHRLRSCFNLVVATCVIYTAICMPVKVAFNTTFLRQVV